MIDTVKSIKYKFLENNLIKGKDTQVTTAQQATAVYKEYWIRFSGYVVTHCDTKEFKILRKNGDIVW